jgi:ABC-type sugar transport system ATPase subunit
MDVILTAGRGEKAAASGKTTMGIRPEDITIAEEGVASKIYIIEPLGRDHLIDVKVGDLSLQLLVDPGLALRIGDTVQLNLNMDKAHFFDPTTERSLLWA